MNRFLIACTLAALCAATGAALAQTGSMSSPMSPAQGAMTQPATAGQMSSPMSSGQMASPNAKKTKKPHATNAMSGGNMSGPSNGGAMEAQPQSNPDSMAKPH